MAPMKRFVKIFWRLSKGSRMKQRVIYILLFLIAIVSCTGNKRYDSMLQRADSLMECTESSAEAAISLLDSMKPQLEDLSKRQKMQYALLYHKAMNKADIPMTSDSVMKEVADYYDSHGSANEQMLANYVLGCVYRDLHEAPLALEYYNKAVELADTTATDCDYATLYRVYSQMGFLFDKQYLPYQLLYAFGKAEKYAYLAKDTFNAIINYQNKEGAFEFLGKQDSCISVNVKAGNMFKQIGNSYAASISFGGNLKYYIEQNDRAKAKEAFDAYFSTGFEGNSNYEDAKAYILCQKGEYYLFTSLLDSAYNTLMQSIKLCKSYGNKSLAANMLAQLYTKKNQPALALKYAMLSSEYSDSAFVETRKSQLQQMQSMYDYSRNQEIARKAEQKAERSTKINFLIVFSCLFLLLLISYIYRKQLFLRKKRVAATKLLYEDCLLQLKKTEKDLQLLKAENDKKLTWVIMKKENSINKLKEEMKAIREKYSQPLLSDTDLLLMESSIYKRIKYIEVHPKEKMSAEDWEKLAKEIENLIPAFIPQLKNQLNVTDYRICLLVRLGFSTSFIASLLELSASAISSNRKRMLTKICNKNGKPKDFDEFICQLS